MLGNFFFVYFHSFLIIIIITITISKETQGQTPEKKQKYPRIDFDLLNSTFSDLISQNNVPKTEEGVSLSQVELPNRLQTQVPFVQIAWKYEEYFISHNLIRFSIKNYEIKQDAPEHLLSDLLEDTNILKKNIKQTIDQYLQNNSQMIVLISGRGYSGSIALRIAQKLKIDHNLTMIALSFGDPIFFVNKSFQLFIQRSNINFGVFKSTSHDIEEILKGESYRTLDL